ncbi:MAG: hypothetical protein U5N10_10105 [Gemmobacter sp.]|nr:hypothetical protein [Gemmobacter sp.]
MKERLPDANLQSLDTLFKPENAAKLADCGISILDSPTDIGFMVMAWLGIDAEHAPASPDYRRGWQRLSPRSASISPLSTIQIT